MMPGFIKRWFESRFEVEKLREPVLKQLHKPLPKNTAWFHTLGSMSFFLFISQVITGILLLIYYRPTVHEAFGSVQFITTKAAFGWLYRQIHAWGSTAMIIIVFLHLLRTYFMGSYKKPRELTWMFGAVLFIVTLSFGFTGYLLPWSQLSYWATTVGTEMAGSVPVIGEWIKTFLRGGHAVNGETLSRFFVMHVIILPWACFFLIIIHLVLVRVQGIATLEPVGGEEKVDASQGIPFYPHHLLKEGIVWFVLLGVLITFAILMPFELGEKADPLETPYAVKPDWYFLPMYQVIKYFPKLIGLIVVSLGPLFMLFWPLLDRTKERSPWKRPVSVTIGIIVLLSFLVMGMMGYVSETKREFFGKTYEFNIYGVPHLVSSKGELH